MSPQEIDKGLAALAATLNDDYGLEEEARDLDRLRGSVAELIAFIKAKATEDNQPWSPIESAPKDGTPVDLWVCVIQIDNDGRVLRDGYRAPDVKWTSKGRWETRGEIVEVTFEGGRNIATHWRREPSPPEKQPLHRRSSHEQ